MYWASYSTADKQILTRAQQITKALATAPQSSA